MARETPSFKKLSIRWYDCIEVEPCKKAEK